MKILALDIGDIWVGSAISDPLGITCKPYKTVNFTEIDSFLNKTINEENIDTVIIGNPITMKGGKSQQTQKIIQTKEELENKFKNIKWVLWDERLSSKRAEILMGKKFKKNKNESHSIAAAFILQSYLDNKIIFKT